MMIVKYAKVRISTSSVIGGGVGNNNNDNNTDILMTMQYPDLYAVPLVLMLVVIVLYPQLQSVPVKAVQVGWEGTP